MGYGNCQGLTPRQLGASGGAERVALGPNEMPVHNHAARVNAVKEEGPTRPPAGHISRATPTLS
jgi:microcystin-dependent protein